MLSPVLLLAREIDTEDRAVIATDAEGRVIYWGAGAQALYGWSGDEVMGRHINELTPEDAEQGMAILQTLREGHPWSGAFEVRTRTGERFTAAVTDIPVHDTAGRLLGIVGISQRGPGHFPVSQ